MARIVGDAGRAIFVAAWLAPEGVVGTLLSSIVVGSGLWEVDMVTLDITQGRLHLGERFSVSFQRTLRIPDDGRTYPLPPGLGAFPIYRVADFVDRVPPTWREHGGVFIPMYQREALWLAFHAAAWKPNAVKVAVGRVNAISGAPEEARLHADPQDYVVCPEQLWLDGIHTGQNAIRQFVAMPLGLGYSVEASVTGTEQFGGMQITVFEPQPGKFPEEPPVRPASDSAGPVRLAGLRAGSSVAQTMGLGAGGGCGKRSILTPTALTRGTRTTTCRSSSTSSTVRNFLRSPAWRRQQPRSMRKCIPTLAYPGSYSMTKVPVTCRYQERLTQVKTIAERDAERGEPTEGEASFEVSAEQTKTWRRDDSGTARGSSSSSETTEHV